MYPAHHVCSRTQGIVHESEPGTASESCLFSWRSYGDGLTFLALPACARDSLSIFRFWLTPFGVPAADLELSARPFRACSKYRQMWPIKSVG